MLWNVRRCRPNLEQLENRLVPSADVLSHHNDLANTGVNPNETVLTPSNVNSTSFGKLFSTAVDGQVYAQPLAVTNVNITTGNSKGFHDVIFVGTEHDSLYAIDAHSGQVLWHDSFLSGLAGATVTTIPSSAVNSTGVGTEVGITGTPVIDPNTQTLYVVAETQEVLNGNNHYIQRLHAVSLADGSEKFGGSVVIADTSYNSGTYTYNSGPTVTGTGDGSVGGKVTYNALRQLPRAALALANGTVYLATAGHNGDIPPYHGWVLGFNAANLQLTAAFNTTPNGGDGGIWQAGGSVSVDPQGFLYVETGNGTFDATLTAAGFPNQNDFGDSVIKLAVDTSSSPTSQNGNGWGLKVVDYFAPDNQATLNKNDTDLGSQSPVILPDAVGNTQHPHLLEAAGKEGTIYLIDRDNMGHFSATANNVVQVLTGAIGGTFGTPAFFNNALYYVTPSTVAKTFTIANGSAQITATPSSQSSDSFGYPGATTSISSNAGSNGIAWDLDKGTNTLRAYTGGNYASELYTSAQASGGRDTLGTLDTFAVPIVVNGRVFVGVSGALVAYGLLAATPATPNDLKVTVANGSVNVTWSASIGATSYDVYRSTTSGGEGLTPLKTVVTLTSFTDTAPPAGTTYFYQVSAVGAGGESARSAEAATGLTTNERFVEALYVDYLGRTGAMAELDGWVSQLPSLGQGGVSVGIEHSTEATRRLVDSYYTTFLSRAAVGGEDSYWVNLFAQPGATQEQVIAAFVSSPEFGTHAAALIGSSDANTNFVLALYDLLLHRTGSAVSSGEVNGWLNALPTLGRTGVASGFLGSGEFRADAVRTFYGDPTLATLPTQPFLPDLLHRSSAPTSSEISAWVNSSLDLFGIEAGFAASAEFYNRS